MIVLADADEQRATRARAHHAAGLARADCRDGIRTAELRDRPRHGQPQVAVVVRMNEMHDDFRVGLRGEPVSLADQARAQGFEVLDDAVVNHRDLIVRNVRVRVGGSRCAVRRPTRVRDAGCSYDGGRFRPGREVGDTRDAHQSMHASVDHRETARVVTSVFEPSDALDEYGNHVFARYGSDNSAHDAQPFLGRCQPVIVTCLFCDSVSSPAGTSLVMVAPAAIVAPRWTVTGATSCVSDPMCTSSSMIVRCLFAPS